MEKTRKPAALLGKDYISIDDDSPKDLYIITNAQGIHYIFKHSQIS
ncbi:MAG: hypothetical protein LUG24_09595 [Clostridiales bacterium]|nr:hypothetical protein [Clostridiales bacterium]